MLHGGLPPVFTIVLFHRPGSSLKASFSALLFILYRAAVTDFETFFLTCICSVLVWFYICVKCRDRTFFMGNNFNLV